jgi:RNA polymerase sigma factor (sigma-70 family)
VTRERGGRFGETRWTLVLDAGDASSPKAQEALATLCRHYWSPLHAFVRAQGYSPEDAEDLTQSFFERLIARRDLSAVDPARGRFRSFLLAALKHFLANARDRDRTVKRGGRHVHVRLDDPDPDVASFSATEQVTPETLFEQQWLAAVIQRVCNRLEAETDEARRPLVRHLASPVRDAENDRPLREVAASLGMSDGAARVALHRLRRRFRDLLQEEIADTVADSADIEDEIRHLFAVAAGGRRT